MNDVILPHTLFNILKWWKIAYANGMDGVHKGNGIGINFGYFDTYYENSKQYFSILWSIYAKNLHFNVIIRASFYQHMVIFQFILELACWNYDTPRNNKQTIIVELLTFIIIFGYEWPISIVILDLTVFFANTFGVESLFHKVSLLYYERRHD